MDVKVYTTFTLLKSDRETWTIKKLTWGWLDDTGLHNFEQRSNELNNN